MMTVADMDSYNEKSSLASMGLLSSRHALEAVFKRSKTSLNEDALLILN